MLPGRRTADGALFVTQGPPPAGTPLVGGIAVRADGTIYVSQSFTQPFDPSDLFASGEQGVFFDPSDLSTMFQDSAGLTPVTADGQPVGKILDKSGRGNHASQATASKRPLYKTSGGLHWLQFDGVDDVLVTASAIGISAAPISYFFGLVNNNTSVEKWISASTRYTLSAQPSGVPRFTAASAKDYDGSTGFFVQSVKTIGAWLYDNLFDVSFRKDGALRETVLGSIDAHVNENILSIGATPNSGFPLNGNVYSLIILGRLATTQEITDTETWVASKTGVTLP